jgi:hypothetical protein
MRMRAVQQASLIVLGILGLAGCTQSYSTSQRESGDRLRVAAAMEAAGGSDAWRQCNLYEATGVVTTFQPDGSRYLTQHAFRISPWSHTLTITAHEPLSNFAWQLVGHQFQQTEGNASQDISPLAQDYAGYAEAIMEIVTAPVRLQEWNVGTKENLTSVVILGRSYHAVNVGSPAGIERSYYQDQNSFRVDMVWLANAERTHFFIVRGYEYASVPPTGVLVPTKIEIFRSDAARQPGPRLVEIDMGR